MSPLFYRGQKGEVYCLWLQKEPVLSLRLEPKSSIAKQPITYVPDYWSPSSSPSSSSRTMVPYADLTALPPPHCPITFPNADSLRLSHHSHFTSLSQAFPRFSCLLPPSSNMLSSAEPKLINSEFLNAHSMLCLSFMEATSAAFGKRLSEFS